MPSRFYVYGRSPTERGDDGWPLVALMGMHRNRDDANNDRIALNQSPAGEAIVFSVEARELVDNCQPRHLYERTGLAYEEVKRCHTHQ